jgi:hypothetical protein
MSQSPSVCLKPICKAVPPRCKALLWTVTKSTPGTPPSGGSASAIMKQKLLQEQTEETEKLIQAERKFAWLRLLCWFLRFSVPSVGSC